VRQKSTALQRATSMPKRAEARRAATVAGREGARRKSSAATALLMDGKRGEFECEIAGCSKRFRRKEHRRRHMQTDK